ncbi:MAG: polysaccharide export protein [Alphaproteobacteria bacterium]|nr:polysaccharide export protein [Alphaproteobacteria bacterium]
MRLRRLLVLCLAALALTACAREAPRYAMAPQAQPRSDLDMMMYGAPAAASRTVRHAQRAVPVQSGPAPIVEDAGTYTLDSGDKLRIVVFGQDALSNTYAVSAAGQVTMPLIGAVNARGMTTQQLSQSIAGRLKQSFIRDPSVAVEVETYRPFFVLGEVTYPGQYPYVPGMTVQNAVAIAGGFTPRASKSRVTLTRTYNGVPARYALPMHYPVRPGDTLTVGERWF